MSRIITRRALITSAAVGGAGLLNGCDKVANDPGFRKILFSGREDEWGLAARADGPDALAPEFAPTRCPRDSAPTARATRTRPITTAMLADRFADWRLQVGGLVTRPLSLSLAQIRSMPTRVQITRHDCVEGWSAIGQWHGPMLGTDPEGGGPALRCALYRVHLRRPVPGQELLQIDRCDRRLPSPDDPRLGDEQCSARRGAWCAASPAGSNGSSATSMRNMSCASMRSPRWLESAGARRLLGRYCRLRLVCGHLIVTDAKYGSDRSIPRRAGQARAAHRPSRQRHRPVFGKPDPDPDFPNVTIRFTDNGAANFIIRNPAWARARPICRAGWRSMARTSWASSS